MTDNLDGCQRFSFLYFAVVTTRLTGNPSHFNDVLNIQRVRPMYEYRRISDVLAEQEQAAGV